MGWQGIAGVVALAILALSLVGVRAELASAGPEAEASGTASVVINHFAYHPPTLRVRRGTTVSFVNRSGIAHTATLRGSFDTGRIRPGGSVAVRFTQRGTFTYHCTIHPFMHGKIVVE